MTASVPRSTVPRRCPGLLRLSLIHPSICGLESGTSFLFRYACPQLEVGTGEDSPLVRLNNDSSLCLQLALASSVQSPEGFP